VYTRPQFVALAAPARPATRLGLARDLQAFTRDFKAEMTEGLACLDRRLPRNATVRLDPRRRNPIVVSPLEPQPEPPNLEALKGELGRRWPMTSLLDILKEADLRIGFTDTFTTAPSRARPTGARSSGASCCASTASARTLD
jgi:hypothetical protein